MVVLVGMGGNPTLPEEFGDFLVPMKIFTTSSQEKQSSRQLQLSRLEGGYADDMNTAEEVPRS